MIIHEHTHYASGAVEHRHTLYGAGRPVGEIVSFEADSGTAPPAQRRTFHSDAQGSILAVTDSTGAVLTRYRYDPWGKQTLISGSNTGIAATRQGHTGHEMLAGGFTHMNGRLYDPILSRFISADPLVQDTYDLQHLNRYSYVLNNPLYYTDPTGFSAWTDFRDGFLKPAAGIAAGVMFGPGGAWALTGNAFANSMIAGAISGGIAGGKQGALQGALSGGLFYGAGQLGNTFGMANNSIGRALLHAGAGCIAASAGGGNCGTGAMTAGFTKFAASNVNVGNDSGANLIKYAVIGGTASVIGGGKFANGAMTGAWQYLFNDLAHKADGKLWATQPTADEYAAHYAGGTGETVYRMGSDVNLAKYPSGQFDAPAGSVKGIYPSSAALAVGLANWELGTLQPGALTDTFIYGSLGPVKILGGGYVQLGPDTLSFPLFFVFQPDGIMPPISLHAER